MDHLSRLIVSVVLLLAAGLAQAGTFYRHPVPGSTSDAYSSWYSSQSAVCSAWSVADIAYRNSVDSPPYSSTAAGAAWMYGGCVYNQTRGNGNPDYTTTSQRYTAVQQQSCDGTSVPNAQGTCGPPPADCASVAAGLGSNGVLFTTGALGGGSCAFTARYGGCFVQGSITGTDANGSYIGGPFTVGSSACTGGGGDAQPSQLPPGKCPGTVNGASVVVPCGTVSTAGPTNSQTTPSGAASAPPGITGGQNSTTTTTCTGGSCTTTTNIYSNGGGGGGPGTLTGTSTTTQPERDYCAQNPKAPQCDKEGDGSFGGSCAGGFTCDGDAVQCAIASDQHRRHCQLFDLGNPLEQVGTPAMNGQARPAGHPGLSPTASSMEFSSVIDRTDRLGGSCPGDLSIATSGAPLVIPLSTMCGPMQMLGQLMVGICMLGALGIVFKN